VYVTWAAHEAIGLGIGAQRGIKYLRRRNASWRRRLIREEGTLAGGGGASSYRRSVGSEKDSSWRQAEN